MKIQKNSPNFHCIEFFKFNNGNCLDFSGISTSFLMNGNFHGNYVRKINLLNLKCLEFNDSSHKNLLSSFDLILKLIVYTINMYFSCKLGQFSNLFKSTFTLNAKHQSFKLWVFFRFLSIFGDSSKKRVQAVTKLFLQKF